MMTMGQALACGFQKAPTAEERAAMLAKCDGRRGVNGTCPRCGGAAFVGLLKVRCLSPWGCKRYEPEPVEMRVNGEPRWIWPGANAYFATREAAMAWRAKR